MKALHSLALLGASLVWSTLAVAQDKPAARVAAAKATAKPAPTAMLAKPEMADAEQLLAASQTYMGAYDCEFKQALSITKHPVDGYVVVTFSAKAYNMKPVRSSTGAVRLEEIGGGPMLLVQIPAKSMLMDTVRGRRIVDACVHEEQAKEVAAPNSLGMNLQGQVSTADSATIKR